MSLVTFTAIRPQGRCVARFRDHVALSIVLSFRIVDLCCTPMASFRTLGNGVKSHYCRHGLLTPTRCGFGEAWGRIYHFPVFPGNLVRRQTRPELAFAVSIPCPLSKTPGSAYDAGYDAYMPFEAT